MLETPSKSDVLNALRRRRSISRVKPERPPRELVETIIEAGSLAPNHHHTRPWRFLVLAGTAREELGEVMAASQRLHMGGQPEEDVEVQARKQRGKPLRAPIIIVVAVEPSISPKVIEIEEIAAGAAAVENMLIAAEALGLGAMWRTGPAAYDPAVKHFLGLAERAHIVSFLYLGYPDMPEFPDRLPDSASLTQWIGWDDMLPTNFENLKGLR